jgi:hypothetical protein
VIFVQFVAKSQVMFKDKIIHKELSYKIVGLAMQVHTELGFGFLEKVYENSLMILLRENGIKAEQQVPIKVYFQGQIVGEYVADILDKHKVQTLNYLKATNLKLGILLNFGKQKLEYERLVL